MSETTLRKNFQEGLNCFATDYCISFDSDIWWRKLQQSNYI